MLAARILRRVHAGRAPFALQHVSMCARSYHPSASVWKEYPPHTVMSMPALSPTMETGSIVEWGLSEGQSFGAGDLLCEIETDKATLSFEAQDDGVLAKILRQGENARDLPIGTAVCVVCEEEEDVPAFSDFSVEGASAAAPSPAPASADDDTPSESSADSPPPPSVASQFVLLPSARHMAESKGLDATGLVGTGKGGRVTKGDVLKALADGVDLPKLRSAPLSTEPPKKASAEATAPAPKAAIPPPTTPGSDLPLPDVSPSGGFADTKNGQMRKIIAKRLTESKRDVPHFYTSMDIELDSILALRKQLAKDHDIKVSVNDFVLKGCAMALRDVPEVNASYSVSKKEIITSDSIDISVAVATPTGLITPIVTGIDKRGLVGITTKVRDLATRARDGKLSPDEYQGGTFTVSNLGMFGIDEFSAVINPPQAAILAVGSGSKRIVPTPYVDGAATQQPPAVKVIMTARLSADRRVVDEATAALFMQSLQFYMSQPKMLML